MYVCMYIADNQQAIAVAALCELTRHRSYRRRYIFVYSIERKRESEM